MIRNETELANKYMNRNWVTQTALTLVANIEQTVALPKGHYFLRIDSAVDLNLEFNLVNNTTSVTANTPIAVLAGFPDIVHVPQGLVNDESDQVIYVHFESTAGGSVKWVSG